MSFDLNTPIIDYRIAKPQNDGKECIVIDKMGGIYFAKWSMPNNRFENFDGLKYEGIVYWAPKPKVPKGLKV